jgi:uncharacterized membrane protein
LSVSDILQLLAGLILVGVGVVKYRRRAREDGSRGSQIGVILIVFGLIALILAFDLLEYRPSQSEIDAQSVPRQRP